MQDVKQKISKIKRNGILLLWKYKIREKDYPGWNMTLDENMYTYFEKISKLILQSNYKIKVTIPINKPFREALMVPNHSLKLSELIYPEKLNILFNPKSHQDHFILHKEKQVLNFEFGKSKFNDFTKTISDKKAQASEVQFFSKESEENLFIWRFPIRKN